MATGLITLLDTATASENLGDEIIMDACRRHLRAIFPDAFFVSSATHAQLSETGLEHMARSDHIFMCGTNILSDKPYRRWQFIVRRRDLLRLRDIILLGVGWLGYRGRESPIARYLYPRMLRRDAIHSVREIYAQKKLAAYGVPNVLVTGCPTLWDINAEVAARIPTSKGAVAVATLTDYKRDPEADRTMLEKLVQTYDRVYVWPQGSQDRAYGATIAPKEAVWLEPSLAAYDALLRDTPSIDYVGTRLHGGIRAMAHGRRALIISVDNRATEMGRDFRLWTLLRDDIGNRLDAAVRNGPTEKFQSLLGLRDEWAVQFGSVKRPDLARPLWRSET